MNTKTFFAVILGAAFSFTLAQAEEKTVSEKSAAAWDKTKETAKEVSDAVVKKTKETVAAVEHKIDQPDADARKVAVKMTDQGVQMSRSLSAGKTAFLVTNTGKQNHNFKITGNNLDESFWFTIAPGGDKTMQVDLKAGTYEAVCSVDAHGKKEPKVKLTVK
jgi:uncharacterized cupredoxin-like copper-binding protein